MSVTQETKALEPGCPPIDLTFVEILKILQTSSATNRWSLVSLLLALVIASILYPRLPNPVPIHWDARGMSDGFTPKPLGVFLGPVVMAGLWMLFTVLPRIFPKGFQLSQFEGTCALLRNDEELAIMAEPQQHLPTAE